MVIPHPATCREMCCLVPDDGAPQCAKHARCTARDGHAGACVMPLDALVMLARKLFRLRAGDRI